MGSRREFICGTAGAAALLAGARFANATPTTNGSIENTAISCFRGNAMRNFGGTGPLSATPTLRWAAELGTFATTYKDGSPRIWKGTGWTGQAVADGRHVWVGGVDAKLRCWDRFDGRLRWELAGGRMFKSSPCLHDGRLYVGNVDNLIRAVDSLTGQVIWTHDTGADCDSSPIMHQGRLYCAGEAGFLRVLDPATGKLLWRLDLGGHGGPPGSCGAEGSVAIDGDELFVGTFDGTVHCISIAEQRILWQFQTGGDTDATVALTPDCYVVGAEEESPRLYCVDRKTHQQRWSINNGSGWWASAAIAQGRVYAGGNDGHLWCIDLQTGAVLFKVKTGGPVWSSPCVVDGKVVFGSHDGKIRIIDATTGAQLWNYDTGERVLSTPCIVDGWIYIGGSCGRFFAFH